MKTAASTALTGVVFGSGRGNESKLKDNITKGGERKKTSHKKLAKRMSTMPKIDSLAVQKVA